MIYIEDWVDRALSCFCRDGKEDKNNIEHSFTVSTACSLYNSTTFEKQDEIRLNEDFESLLRELGVSLENREVLNKCSTEKKIALLTTKELRPSTDCSCLISLLKEIESQIPLDTTQLARLQHIVITLRTESELFITEFESLSGRQILCSSLQKSLNFSNSSASLAYLYAFRALLNTSSGRLNFLHDKEVLKTIAKCIQLNDVKCKTVSVEILSGLCFIPEGGHTAVLKAITEISEDLGERTRFQSFVENFFKSYNSERDTDRVRTSILGLFNSLLQTPPTQDSVVYRSHLRLELLMLGLPRGLSKSRHGASSRLENHLDLFEMMRKEDDLQLHSCSSSEDSGACSPVEVEGVVGAAEALQDRLQSSTAKYHLLSMMQHLLMMPTDEESVWVWQLIDLVVQQMTLKATAEGVEDVNRPIKDDIPMTDVLARLQTQKDFERVQTELLKANAEIEKQKERLLDLEKHLSVEICEGRRSSTSGVSTMSSEISSPPSPDFLLPVSRQAAPPPPPPPPNGLLLPGFQQKPKIQKKVPAPLLPVKCFNWIKIDEQKVQGSIWEGIEDEKVYKNIDLQDLDDTFAAGSSKQDNDDNMSTISRRREHQITVIDPRRYQNCMIMLSKLRLNHKEIKGALLTMDDKGKLPRDMIEQMLKFLPTREEVQLLSETVARHRSASVLAVADRYLYEVSLMPRFEQRLRCLHHIRAFNDRLDLIAPPIQAVTKACGLVTSSKRFRQWMAVILAVGNHLNHGKRNGNALGFDLHSLLNLQDVKWASRADRNLLHYILSWAAINHSDLLKIRRELAVVATAARFNRGEAATELRGLEQAIKAVSAELVYQQTNGSKMEDCDEKMNRFIPVAKNFLSTASIEFGTLEKAHNEMKTKLSECARFLCFDPKSGSDEVFFVLWRWVQAVEEHQKQLNIEHEEKEKAHKHTIARTYFAKKGRRKEKEEDFERLISALQSGDIFKDELTRLRTSFRPKKEKGGKTRNKQVIQAC